MTAPHHRIVPSLPGKDFPLVALCEGIPLSSQMASSSAELLCFLLLIWASCQIDSRVSGGLRRCDQFPCRRVTVRTVDWGATNLQAHENLFEELANCGVTCVTRASRLLLSSSLVAAEQGLNWLAFVIGWSKYGLGLPQSQLTEVRWEFSSFSRFACRRGRAKKLWKSL